MRSASEYWAATGSGRRLVRRPGCRPRQRRRAPGTCDDPCFLLLSGLCPRQSGFPPATHRVAMPACVLVALEAFENVVGLAPAGAHRRFGRAVRARARAPDEHHRRRKDAATESEPGHGVALDAADVPLPELSDGLEVPLGGESGHGLRACAGVGAPPVLPR